MELLPPSRPVGVAAGRRRLASGWPVQRSTTQSGGSARLATCPSRLAAAENSQESAPSGGPPADLPLLQPEGQGVYTWSDGSVYEGSWHEGLKHGWGTYSWPNGAQYKGEWHRGLLQVCGRGGNCREAIRAALQGPGPIPWETAVGDHCGRPLWETAVRDRVYL